jgi:hypothetical protein
MQLLKLFEESCSDPEQLVLSVFVVMDETSIVSEKVTEKLSLIDIDELSAIESMLIVGIIPSIIKFLLAPRDPEAPGDAKVKFASFVALSFIVPLFKENELVVL